MKITKVVILGVGSLLYFSTFGVVAQTPVNRDPPCVNGMFLLRVFSLKVYKLYTHQFNKGLWRISVLIFLSDGRWRAWNSESQRLLFTGIVELMCLQLCGIIIEHSTANRCCPMYVYMYIYINQKSFLRLRVSCKQQSSGINILQLKEN